MPSHAGAPDDFGARLTCRRRLPARRFQTIAAFGGLVLVTAMPRWAGAHHDATLPPDLLNGTYYGIRAVMGSDGTTVNKLEQDGDHVHNCGNVLLNITNFGLIGSRPGLNFRF